MGNKNVHTITHGKLLVEEGKCLDQDFVLIPELDHLANLVGNN